MYKKSEEKSQWILNLYNEGGNLFNIAKITTSSRETVKKVLLKFGIDYHKVEAEKLEQRNKEIVEHYKNGKSQLWIEDNYKITRKTLRGLLKSIEDVHYREKSEALILGHGTTINHNCFDELTPEACYWLGLLWADGHHQKPGNQYGIELCLHNDDKEHLIKCLTFLGSSRQIKPCGEKNCSRLRINSEIIHSRMKELNFHNRKSNWNFPHVDLKESKDFWRGCIDGDGGVYNYKNCNGSIFFCGHIETVVEFIRHCSKYVGIKEKLPSECKSSNYSIHQVHYYGSDAQKLAEYFYKDCIISLDRKQEKANNIMLKEFQ